MLDRSCGYCSRYDGMLNLVAMTEDREEHSQAHQQYRYLGQKVVVKGSSLTAKDPALICIAPTGK